MGELTAISWTDHTFNPWIGCQRVSPACNNCYAETLNKRWGQGNWGKDAPRRVTADANWRKPLKWNRDAEAAGVPAFVFCASMADVFEDRPDLDQPRDRLWKLIDETPWLTWLLLTKRPENIARMVPVEWMTSGFPSNVWAGTTVEDQRRAEERLPHLARIPAPVRFLSCEPLLGYVDLLHHVEDIEWIICGGESGAGFRPLDLHNARMLRQQCIGWDVPFWFKQVGGIHPTSGGDLLDGELWHQRPPGAALRGGGATPEHRCYGCGEVITKDENGHWSADDGAGGWFYLCAAMNDQDEHAPARPEVTP